MLSNLDIHDPSIPGINKIGLKISSPSILSTQFKPDLYFNKGLQKSLLFYAIQLDILTMKYLFAFLFHIFILLNRLRLMKKVCCYLGIHFIFMTAIYGQVKADHL